MDLILSSSSSQRHHGQSSTCNSHSVQVVFATHPGSTRLSSSLIGTATLGLPLTNSKSLFSHVGGVDSGRIDVGRDNRAALLRDVGQILPAELTSDQIKELKSQNNNVAVSLLGRGMIGEHHLRSLEFVETIRRLVGGHIAAKRFLTAIDLAYYTALSAAASKKSLQFQGGPFEWKGLQMPFRTL